MKKLIITLFTLTAIPAVLFSQSIDEGKQTFTQFCGTCHGNTGLGDGPAAAALNPKPRNLQDADYMNTKTDEQLFNVIKNGGAENGFSPIMPPWGASLNDETIQSVVMYIRSLSEKK